MQIDHNIDACFSDVCENGIDRDFFEAWLGRAARHGRRFQSQLTKGEHPFLGIALDKSDLPAMQEQADRLRNEFDQVLFLGTGGSSLGAQALTALAPFPVQARIKFADNLDGSQFQDMLNGLNPARTATVAVSKSGGTTETLAQTAAVIDWYRRMQSEEVVARNMLVITEPTDNPLRRLADRFDMPVLVHDPDVGGRFSVLTIVGGLPGMVAGLDVSAMRDGAGAVLDSLSRNPTNPAVKGAALTIGLTVDKQLRQQVMLPYAGRLDLFADWHRQLWAESLGKNGLGQTPISGLGPVDQHSQLQLWADGPLDKLFTILTVDSPEPGPVVSADLVEDPALAYMAERSFGDIVTAQAKATSEALIECGRPVRRISIETLDEASLGVLFAHFMLETVIAADLLGISAFGQPGVEGGKARTRQYLQSMGS